MISTLHNRGGGHRKADKVGGLSKFHITNQTNQFQRQKKLIKIQKICGCHKWNTQTLPTKQGPTLQETTSWVSTESWLLLLEQWLPSTERSPLQHTLSLFLLPMPQVKEQGVHGYQGDHMGLPTLVPRLGLLWSICPMTCNRAIASKARIMAVENISTQL